MRENFRSAKLVHQTFEISRKEPRLIRVIDSIEDTASEVEGVVS